MSTEFANIKKDLRPIAIIATEYNLGPTITSQEQANPNEYGLGIVELMYASTLIHVFFPNK